MPKARKFCFDSVRQFILAAPDGSEIRWLAHGPYRVKGVEGPIEVFELGVPQLSPLHPRANSEKASRDIVPEDAALGWRPAVGQGIPHRMDWQLDRKLGEGSFGEAWLAVHQRSADPRVFKFCFEPDSLRTLKRELTLLRVLKNSLGERPDIARLLDWQLESPPYYLESEYAPGGDLPTWAEDKGGLSNIPVKTRLELVAQTAQAIAAAHQVGVLHNDIKPSNILIANDVQPPIPEAGRTRDAWVLDCRWRSGRFPPDRWRDHEMPG